jgi:ABC-2 type transport system permease protein
VAEREQGVWRRYRLLPVPIPWLLFSAMLARVLIVASSILVQIAMARAIFGTPFPNHPGAATVSFLFVIAAFLGIGLLIAAMADSVPAVQALGQCIFLPMIMIGGVGVPLAVLPVWAQRFAGFMPGRYAVEVLQPCFSGPDGIHGAGFRLGSLAVIGIAAGVSGTKLFRWEAGRRKGSARWWVAAALTSWVTVGAFAWATDRLRPVLSEAAVWSAITETQIAAISLDNLPADDGMVVAMASPTLESASSREFARKLAVWPQGKVDEGGQSVRNLVSLAAVADLCTDPREAEIGRLVFRQISSRFEPAAAQRALAWIILNPEDGRVLTRAPELGLFRHPPERLIRQRSVIYAEKYLGRLAGKIPE